MRFLLDAHLPPALATALREAGHDCDETRLLLAPDATDVDIAAIANELGAVLVSKDADFLGLKQRGLLKTPLIRVRFPNMTARRTVAEILPRLPQLLSALERGEDPVEIP